MKSSAVLLHNSASDNVFKRFVELREFLERKFDNVGIPLADLVVMIWDVLNGGFY